LKLPDASGKLLRVEDSKLSQSRLLKRRRLLALGLSLPALAIAGPVKAAAPRELVFSHTHTGEKLRVTYFDNGQYLQDALTEINYLLRDFRTREIIEIDPRLLDLVHLIKTTAGGNGTLQIISGYRSPATNAMLRATTSGVAKKSFHMKGQAIDIRLTDIKTRVLRDAAIAIGAGGVGYYPASDFLHIDIGPIRYW
jgi:uncharacterized protein YcbK (DUF882 family)